MNTQFLLAAQFDGAPVIPLEKVREHYFAHLTIYKLREKLQSGEIPLPVVRLDPNSQKTMRGVPIEDLARWIDQRAEAARRELRQITE